MPPSLSTFDIYISRVRFEKIVSVAIFSLFGVFPWNHQVATKWLRKENRPTYI